MKYALSMILLILGYFYPISNELNPTGLRCSLNQSSDTNCDDPPFPTVETIENGDSHWGL